MIDIDKSKLVFVHDMDDKIVDQPLETKEIGYYKDSWNRFKKNRASLVAFIIICIVLVFVILGPFMKDYDLPDEDSTNAMRLQYLTPKIPVLEELGIFDGTKTITRGTRFLTYMYHSEFGEGIIQSGMPQELIDDPNDPSFADVTSLTVKVDYYAYTNYITSYLPERYFGIIDTNIANGEDIDPLGEVRRTLTQEKFDEYLEKNYIIDILAIRETTDIEDPSIINFQYEVRLNQFLTSLDQTPEDTYFWFGTNREGRDLFTELWVGARISILMAVAVVMINSIVGLTIGAIAGYYGGLLDLLFDRFREIVSGIPFLAVLTLLTLRYGSPFWVIILAFTLTGWIGSYGTGRLQFYRFKNREYVLAARTLGAADKRIMFKHIFPNTLGLIVTGLALAVPIFVFTEATFSFLGIINYEDAISVGMLIQQGQAVMQVHPHTLLFPATYISILMIAFNLFGNGLRDAFNPSLRGVE
jgi:oligopeptide transport system permease protein